MREKLLKGGRKIKSLRVKRPQEWHILWGFDGLDTRYCGFARNDVFHLIDVGVWLLL
jgi:hypothetical protein